MMGARPLGAAASLRALPARIAQDREGNAILEFAILAPVFLLLLLGTFDIGQMVYGRAVLHGAVEEAARSSSLETANTQVADEKVENALAPILPNASVESSRLSYFDFTDIGRPEAWNDANDDGTCNDGETFTDENRNEYPHSNVD